MAKINHLITLLIISFIRVYRFGFSYLLGACCRFEPSCSAYAIAALSRYGYLKGCWLMSRRLLRCHPWHAGGFDPLP